jgi:hypothetical protein
MSELRPGGLAVIVGGWHAGLLGITRCNCLHGVIVQLEARIMLGDVPLWTFAKQEACRKYGKPDDLFAGEERYLKPLPPPEEVRALDRTRELDECLEHR